MFRGLTALKAGLGSRFALRTFLLFCLCALVPVGVFGVIGYGVVSAELRAHARERLQEASKHYGLLVNDRLIQAEMALLDLARARLAGGEAVVIEDALSRLQDVTVVVTDGAPRAEAVQETIADGMKVGRTLSVSSGAGGPSIHLRVSAQAGAGPAVTAAARLLPADLWDADAVTLAGMGLCVSAPGTQLACIDPDGANRPLIGRGEVLREQWTLFLKPRFGASSWVIEARQPASIALAALATFKTTLLAVAALACLAALLLSAVQIRRSHRPLVVLIEAARRMRTRRFDARVRLQGRDEFAQLGAAFNQLAAGLQRQFRVLRAFARIDRLILARPEVEPVARSVVPRIPRLLGGRQALLVLRAPQGEGLQVYASNSPDITAVSDTGLPMLGQALQDPQAAVPVLLETRPNLAILGLRWSSAAIIVDDALRGVILHGEDRRGSQRNIRHLRGLARRFAVALANEDRERALLRQAYYDGLTALPNRQLFSDRLGQELLHAQRDHAPLALFFIDLDHFKHVNDSLGHSMGDELLRAVAARLAALTRSVDTLARLGGDEFTLVAPGMDSKAADLLARRMLEAMTQPFMLGSLRHVVQASIGIAAYPRDSDNAEDLVRKADTAMYRAKAAGRGRAVFFEEQMNAQAVRRLTLEQKLRTALAGDGLALHFQPKFAASTHRLTGVEALTRWHDPTEGAISPAEFIPLAEECGLIGLLGAWALRTAGATLQDWKRRGLHPGHVAVNVSMHQLRDAEFPRLVQQTLAAFDLQPSELEIEVTESTLAGDVQQVSRLLGSIRELGVHVAMDDFGTGYSSMAALQQLPVDSIKIDRTFVIAGETPGGAALLRALIGAGHALGKLVVAEGVETQAQLMMLQECGCDVLQGYLFSKPLPAEQMESYMRQEAARVSAHADAAAASLSQAS